MSRVCGPAGDQLDGECMVFLVGWKGRSVFLGRQGGWCFSYVILLRDDSRGGGFCRSTCGRSEIRNSMFFID